MKEIWKDIEGYEGIYQVSNLGRVKSFDRVVKHYGDKTRIIKGKIMLQFNTGKKRMYKGVSLSDKSITKFLVHRLVALNFLDNSKNLPIVNHKDGNPSNNALSNLEWCTNSYNTQHGYDRRKANPTSKIT